MPSLQVRDLPDSIYQLLCAEAVMEHRSIAQQAVVILARALQADADQRQRRKLLLAKIQSEGKKKQVAGSGSVGS